jgi:hypothetical protein
MKCEELPFTCLTKSDIDRLEVHPETRLFQKVGFLAPLPDDDFDRAVLDRVN